MNKVEFSQAVKTYKSMVRKAILDVAPSLSYDDVDDLEQDVWTKAWAAADSFDPDKAKIQTWLYTTAQNMTKDWLKTQNRRPELVPEALFQSEDEDGCAVPYYDQFGGDPGADPMLMLEAEQEQDRLGICVGQMPAREQQVWELCFEQELSATEAAGIMGLTPSTVRTLVQRIRERVDVS